MGDIFKKKLLREDDVSYSLPESKMKSKGKTHGISPQNALERIVNFRELRFLQRSPVMLS